MLDSDEYGNNVSEDLEDDDYDCPPCSYEMRSAEAESSSGSGSLFLAHDSSKGLSSEENDDFGLGGYIEVKIPLLKSSETGHKIEFGSAATPNVKKLNFGK